MQFHLLLIHVISKSRAFDFEFQDGYLFFFEIIFTENVIANHRLWDIYAWYISIHDYNIRHTNHPCGFLERKHACNVVRLDSSKKLYFDQPEAKTFHGIFKGQIEQMHVAGKSFNLHEQEVLFGLVFIRIVLSFTNPHEWNV